MTQASQPWTPLEMLAVAAAGQVRDGDLAVVGLGLPQVAALLAQRTHAPTSELLLELGVFDPHPTGPSMGIADPRMWEGAAVFGGVLDVLGSMLHGGRVSLGILSAVQVDPDGSINTTQVHLEDGSLRRINGSGGGNDIASLAGRTLVVLRHEPRRFRACLDFLTSPGRAVGGRRRSELGLPGEGTVAVVSDRAVLEVTDEGTFLHSVHPGEDPEAVLEATPYAVQVRPGGPEVTRAPTEEELRLIRTELDPQGWYTR